MGGGAYPGEVRIMKRFYLDSNVVLDFLLDRPPFAQPANDLLTAVKTGQVELLVSSLTYITSHYVVSKVIGKIAATAALATLFKGVITVNVGASIIEQAQDMQRQLNGH